MSSADEFSRQIKQFSDRIRNAIPESGPISLTEVLNPGFMAKHTSLPDFEALCAAAGIHSAKDFAAFPNDQWEAHIRTSTPFASWEDMQRQAGEEWMRARVEG